MAASRRPKTATWSSRWSPNASSSRKGIVWRPDPTSASRPSFPEPCPAPHTFTQGGQRPSIFEVSPAGLAAVWVTGDDLSSGDLINAARNPQGDLYLAAGSRVLRDTGSMETLLEYPATIEIGSSESIILERTEGRTDEANFFAANDAGTLVWQTQSSESHRRLVSIDNGQLSTLASFGGNDQTPAPAGGAFAGVYQIFGTASMIAVDDGGRVMVSAAVADGPDGLYVYENGQWQTAALFGQTGVGGRNRQLRRESSDCGREFLCPVLRRKCPRRIHQPAVGADRPHWRYAAERSGDHWDDLRVRGEPAR